MVGNHTSRTHTNTIRVSPPHPTSTLHFSLFCLPPPFPCRFPPPFIPPSSANHARLTCTILLLLRDQMWKKRRRSSFPFCVSLKIMTRPPSLLPLSSLRHMHKYSAVGAAKRGLLGHRHQVFSLPGLPLSHAQPQEWGTALRPRLRSPC